MIDFETQRKNRANTAEYSPSFETNAFNRQRANGFIGLPKKYDFPNKVYLTMPPPKKDHRKVWIYDTLVGVQWAFADMIRTDYDAEGNMISPRQNVRCYAFAKETDALVFRLRFSDDVIQPAKSGGYDSSFN